MCKYVLADQSFLADMFQEFCKNFLLACINSSNRVSALFCRLAQRSNCHFAKKDRWENYEIGTFKVIDGHAPKYFHYGSNIFL